MLPVSHIGEYHAETPSFHRHRLPCSLGLRLRRPGPGARRCARPRRSPAPGQSRRSPHDRHLALQARTRHQPRRQGRTPRRRPRARLRRPRCLRCRLEEHPRPRQLGNRRLLHPHLPGTHRQPSDDIGLYRRWVDVPASFAGQRVLWHFDGVYDGAEVFVNGQRVRLPRKRLHRL